MTNLISLERARREIVRLQRYVDLVEGYKVHSLETWIIKEYSITNSMVKVAALAVSKGFTYEGQPVTTEYIKSVIKGPVLDDLHRVIRSGYFKRVRAKKGKPIRFY